MKNLTIFMVIYIAMISTSFWEAYVEGRSAWSKDKYGWKLNFLNFEISGYHFFLFFITFPALLALPLIIGGWSQKLFGILFSAYLSGLVIEDFFWYIVNPQVNFKEFFGPFSDYYPWIKFKNKKIVPVFYLVGILLSIMIYAIFVK